MSSRPDSIDPFGMGSGPRRGVPGPRRAPAAAASTHGPEAAASAPLAPAGATERAFLSELDGRGAADPLADVVPLTARPSRKALPPGIPGASQTALAADPRSLSGPSFSSSTGIQQGTPVAPLPPPRQSVRQAESPPPALASAPLTLVSSDEIAAGHPVVGANKAALATTTTTTGSNNSGGVQPSHIPHSPPGKPHASNAFGGPSRVYGGGFGTARCCSVQWFRDLLREATRSGGVGSAAFTLASSTLGASIISLPAAYATCGWALGTILLALFGALTVYSVYLIGVACEHTGLRSYEELSRVLIGRRFDLLSSIMVIAFCYGSAVAYTISCVKLFDPLLAAWGVTDYGSYWGPRFVTLIVWGTVIFPLSLFRHINSLRYVSLASVVLVVYFIIAMVLHTLAHRRESIGRIGALDAANLTNDFVVGVSLIMYAFCCQPNVFEVQAEMTPRGVRPLTRSAAWSMTFCTIFFVIAGFFGYADFGNLVHGTILDDYHPADNFGLMIAYVCLALKLAVSTLLCVTATRDSILDIAGWGTYLECSHKHRIIVVTGIAIASVAAGLFIPSVTVVFSLLGGVCGSMLGFILPALFVFLAGGWTPRRVGMRDWLGAWALLLIGVATLMFGVVASVYQVFIE